jgi:Protein of unknown function (DUF3052)
MPHKDYSHRDVVDKLGIKPGHRIMLVETTWPLDADLWGRVLERAARPVAGEDEPADVMLVTVDAGTPIVDVLMQCKARLHAAGGIWLLTPKRGQTGYIDQRVLIDAGPPAGLVDNKVCSVSGTVSAIRFVIRKIDRLLST